MKSIVQIIHRLLPARCIKNPVIIHDDCVERGAEKPASLRCLRVGPSWQCERILEYDVKPLSIYPDQIKVIYNTMILILHAFLADHRKAAITPLRLHYRAAVHLSNGRTVGH